MTNNDSFLDRMNGWMQNSVIARMLSIGFLILILLIPSAMIESLISEREYTQESAIDEVSSKWGYSQTITGLVLSIPFNSYFTTTDDAGKKTRHSEIHYLHFLPNHLNIQGILTPEIRKRGIYKVVVYNSSLKISGDFRHLRFDEWKIAPRDIIWKDAFVSLGIPDMRGIQKQINLEWNNKNYEFEPGLENQDIISSGVLCKIPISDTTKNSVFSLDLELRGSYDLNFIPLGKETSIQLKSNWATPKFDGAFLPDSHTVTDSGFVAQWEILHLNRNYPQQWQDDKHNVSSSEFGVSLLIPVDGYQKTYRTAKYSIMFIALTFLIFFSVETFNKKRIHPIQYLLVGLAIIIFYVLLLSLTEHIHFNLAYIISSIAIITLITIYSHSIFERKLLTGIMGGILFILYGFMFTTLQLEDYALLLGSLGLFAVLATIMILSRKINWYTFGDKEE